MSAIRHDFRSDTVTRPSAAMRAAMAAAEVGDDVYGDDPTIRRLEAVLSERVGCAAGLYVPSGTQSNLIALMTHCGRGDEYIAGQQAHCYVNEAGGAAVLASIQPQPIANQKDGTIALGDIEAAIKPDDMHFARTRLLALENTIGGKPISLDYTKDATALAHDRGLATHLDGARIFNAAIALGVEAAEVARGFDTVSVCLSKGLGAPVGSVLCGPKDFIERAVRNRKILGGGMRQAGIIAAAGLFALEHNVDRLAEDHALADELAAGLSQFPALAVQPAATNMVFVEVSGADEEAFTAFLADRGIAMHSRYGRQRWVTHLDVGAADVAAALAAVAAFFA
ncbi:MAG: low-specificity L-threonine aldolase [Alphaproteobacteria bacterium]|nr:low-specificity L-threonine aldolase [Alphaproteobacteria bacterium]